MGDEIRAGDLVRATSHVNINNGPAITMGSLYFVHDDGNGLYVKDDIGAPFSLLMGAFTLVEHIPHAPDALDVAMDRYRVRGCQFGDDLSQESRNAIAGLIEQVAAKMREDGA